MISGEGIAVVLYGWQWFLLLAVELILCMVVVKGLVRAIRRRALARSGRRVLEAVVRDRKGNRITLTTSTGVGGRMHLATFRQEVQRKFPAPDYQLVSVDLRPARPGEE